MAAIVISIINLLFPSPSHSAPKKVDIKTILVDYNSDRSKACQGNLFSMTLDYAVIYKNGRTNSEEPTICVIKVISNTPISGTQHLQIKQDSVWVDACSVSNWPNTYGIGAGLKCSYKFDPKVNVGTVKGTTSVNFLNKTSIGLIDWSIPRLGIGSKLDGGFCLSTNISSLELRVRVVSGSKTYFTNAVKINYLNANTVTYDSKQGYGGTCSSTAINTTNTNTNPNASPSTKSLPQCNITQIRQHTALAKSFNEWRDLYLDATDEIRRAKSGYIQAENNGSTFAMNQWLGLLVQARSLAESLSKDALNVQNQLITLVEQCKFSYGIVVTSPYGFIVTDESTLGYKFPSFPIL